MKSMRSWKRGLPAASVLVLLAGCASAPIAHAPAPQTAPQTAPEPVATTAPVPPPAAPAAKPAYGTFGFDVSGMDPKVEAGDDFFRHANGAWYDRTEIPADRSSFNTFVLLRELAAKRTRELIQTAAATDAPAGSDARKIGDYYASFMDEAGIEAKGIAPLKPELDRIAAIKDRKALARELGGVVRADVDVLNATNLHTDRPFGLWVVEDLKDTSRYLPYLLQGGLGMPDRAYYLENTPKFQELRTKYKAHVATMLSLAGVASGPEAQRKAEGILALETAIAKTHWTGVDTTDVTKTYNPWTKADFAAKAPGLDWTAFFDAAGLGQQKVVVAWQPSALAGMAKLAGSQPLQTWKDYLAFHAVERAAPYLPKAFVAENFAFQGTALSGTPQQSERWKRGVDFTSGALGEAVGKLYVAKYFPPESKAKVQAMVDNILKAFDARIDRLDWMTPETKAKAHEKLANFQVGVGYPDKWRDYSGLEVVRGDALGNAERADLFEYKRNLAKLGKPVDRGEWYMSPQTVNALNAPMQNSISFPAAILEPPFFDPNADPAVNYGAIGGVIGHEVSHGFDDTGALFDARGNLKNWWTDADMAHFKASASQLSAQYDGYQALPDLHVNGELTLGENIADLAGLSVAYDAYKLSLNGAPSPVIDGFTGDQRVFLGWAQNYRSKYREAALRRALLTDVHSPGEYRADTVRNLDPWYDAFGVKAGQKLYLSPDKRVRIW
jgi:putative endopeptidase